MIKEYFLLYLVHGFAMINMGIFSIEQKDIKVSNLSLVKSLKYLGWFGIIHGITEWITMILVVGLYPDFYIHLYNINQILKGISFAFLMYFGVDLLPFRVKYKNIGLKIPIMLFFIISTGYVLLIINYGLDYHILNNEYSVITMRYVMAILSGIASAIALYLNARLIGKTKSIEISRRYKSLAWVFLIYSLLEGLLVQRANYFPANIINRELFVEYFGFSTLFLKAVVGLVINYLLVKVIDTFSWEQEERLNQLKKHRIASEERRKLGLEIHDSIIQGLYAAGLKVEYLSMNKDRENTRNILEEVKRDLTHTIDKTREFISSSALDRIELEDLADNLQQLVEKYNENQSVRISLECEISPLNIGHLSPEKSTQIYYIIQEAICNIIKHSKAVSANVFLEGRCDSLYIRVIDNGVGISIDNLNPRKQFGISSMKERTERVGGEFHIDKIKKGTRIELEIPWEELEDEGTDKSTNSR